MEREIQLDEDVSINYSRNRLKSMDQVKKCLDELVFSPYWYQGYAFRGKQLVMRLRQTMVWFSDLQCPYANNNLPLNAVRFTCLPPLKFPPELKQLMTQVEQKFGQKFNSLLVEKFDANDSQNSQPFVTSMFCKDKESWIESNTKICIVPVGSSTPEKCNWMTKVLVECPNKKDSSKVTKKWKFEPKKKMKFRNRILALNIEHSKEWKIQMPTQRESNAGPFYLLTFRCIDETKALSHLRNYFSLQPLMSEEQLRDCIVRKTLLTKEEKDYYSQLGRNYLYTQKTHAHGQKKKTKRKVAKIDKSLTNELTINAVNVQIPGSADNNAGQRDNIIGADNNSHDNIIGVDNNSVKNDNIIPLFQVLKKRKIVGEMENNNNKMNEDQMKEKDEDMIVFEFLNY